MLRACDECTLYEHRCVMNKYLAPRSPPSSASSGCLACRVPARSATSIAQHICCIRSAKATGRRGMSRQPGLAFFVQVRPTTTSSVAVTYDGEGPPHMSARPAARPFRVHRPVCALPDGRLELFILSVYCTPSWQSSTTSTRPRFL